MPTKTKITKVTKPRKAPKTTGRVKPDTDTTVHRELNLTSPLMRGDDVKMLQTALHLRLQQHHIDWLHVEIDGVYGKQTANVAAFVAWALGIKNSYRVKIRSGHMSEYSQRFIRISGHKTRLDKLRAKNRLAKLRKIRENQNNGAKAAVKWAESKVGVSESPSGSNAGPQISEWEAYWGLGATFWCGIFAGYAVKKVGGAKVSSWLPYGPSIIDDAKAHRNGLVAVSPENAKPGDLVVYWNGEHIGLIRAVSRNGNVITVEGNTSSSNGSQSNGGTVALKERSIASDVTIVARPLY